MEIISGTTEFEITDDTVLTIGKFDGIHKGHELIVNRMKSYRALGYKVCVLTFDIPPAFLGFGKDKKVLMTKEEKERAFDILGIDYLVEFPFNEETAAISAVDFIKDYIVDRLNAKAIVVGYDCTFGRKALGNAGMLVDYGPVYGYEIEVLDKIKDGDREISSTYLRELAAQGRVDRIYDNSFLPYFITGLFYSKVSEVTKGLSFYYIDIDESKVLPQDGCYYTEIYYDESFYPAISYVSDKDRIAASYIYGGVKGIAKGKISLAFMEKVRRDEDYPYQKAMDKIDELIRRDIFEGQKWHHENGRK